ncbi:hypothetical protein ACFYZN_11335 [Streptomyces sp. NPDC001777]|uniref:hypothetical protein n=1 Tax=Streptomyces sp. NPDC001777 TaxID=3364608 RepID=UPI00369FB2C0
MEGIRAFLVLRILGVIPPSRLTRPDLLLVLIKLAESTPSSPPSNARAAPGSRSTPT